MSTYVPPHRRRASVRQPLGFHELIQLMLFATREPTREPTREQTRNERRRATPRPLKFSRRVDEEIRQTRAVLAQVRRRRAAAQPRPIVVDP